ncbi:hypothetical protein [Novosphingobium sp.]|uniref:hypothetical protein n=1 Tax=Novosphingobium sp. TaxID=1874826 RepID=UPI0033420C72
MYYKQIIRTAPNGAVERPWRNREHQFVLGDPKHGNVKHHDEFAVKVDNYGEALEMVERGFSIRMSDGRNPASLVSPASLTFIDEPTEALDDLWTYTMPVPPFGKDVVLSDLQKALRSQASLIERLASRDAATAFAGIDMDELNSFDDSDADGIKLDKFAMTSVISHAYDYAFGSMSSYLMSEEDADDLEVFLELASAADTNRFSSPMHRDNSAVRVTAEMAYARWQLREGSALSVKRMAFLARMTENAVRNSFSKEKIKPDNGLVPFEQALAWLEVRQNFLPQREDERGTSPSTYRALHTLQTHSLGISLANIIDQCKPSAAEATKARELAAAIEARAGKGRLPAVGQIREYGRVLRLSIDRFTTGALTHFEQCIKVNV